METLWVRLLHYVRILSLFCLRYRNIFLYGHDDQSPRARAPSTPVGRDDSGVTAKDAYRQKNLEKRVSGQLKTKTMSTTVAVTCFFWWALHVLTYGSCFLPRISSARYVDRPQVHGSLSHCGCKNHTPTLLGLKTCFLCGTSSSAPEYCKTRSGYSISRYRLHTTHICTSVRMLGTSWRGKVIISFPPRLLLEYYNTGVERGVAGLRSLLDVK